MSEKLYTLDEAKALLKKELREELEKGSECPVCTQFAKMYKRSLYASVAYDLMRLYYKCKYEDKYYHIGEFSARKSSGGGDFAKLLYWELVEEMPKDPDDTTTRTSGYWKITDRGIDFVDGNLTITSHVKLYDGKSFGFVGDQISIQDALGDKFDYAEIMGKMG